MATKFRPATLAMVEEGRLLVEVESQFAAMQRRLCEYVQEHGDRAEGAKAKLILTVEVKAEHVSPDEPGDSSYSISTDIRASIPTRPKRASTAIAGEDDDGTPRLFARASGTSEGEPRQLRLATEDGRVVDPETGEVIEKKKGTKR